MRCKNDLSGQNPPLWVSLGIRLRNPISTSRQHVLYIIRKKKTNWKLFHSMNFSGIPKWNGRVGLYTTWLPEPLTVTRFGSFGNWSFSEILTVPRTHWPLRQFITTRFCDCLQNKDRLLERFESLKYFTWVKVFSDGREGNGNWIVLQEFLHHIMAIACNYCIACKRGIGKYINDA